MSIWQPLQQQLAKRNDRGTFWWELRSCTYYEQLTRPKIVYQEIHKLLRLPWTGKGSRRTTQCFSC